MKLRLPRVLPILILLLACGQVSRAQDRRGPTLGKKPPANKTLENLLDEHAEVPPQGTVARPHGGSTDPAITTAWEQYDAAVRAASARLLARIEKDLQRATRPPSDAEATAGLEAAQKAFLDHGCLPTLLDTALRAPRRDAEAAYRDAALALQHQYEKAATNLRKTAHDEEADALVQEWSLLQSSLKLAEEPQLDSIWKHSITDGPSAKIMLYSNGTINSPEGPDTWSLTGTTLVIRWQNPDAPGGAWVDTCEVSDHGGAYSGTNQLGTRISGTRVP
jgi:hypothetical protein